MAVLLEPKTSVRASRRSERWRGCRSRAARPRRSWPTSRMPTGRPAARSSPSSTASRARSASSTRSARCSTRPRAGSRTRASRRTESRSPSSTIRRTGTTAESRSSICDGEEDGAGRRMVDSPGPRLGAGRPRDLVHGGARGNRARDLRRHALGKAPARPDDAGHAGAPRPPAGRQRPPDRGRLPLERHGLPPGPALGRELSWFDWSSDRALSADGKLLLFDESGEGGGANGGVYLRPTDGSPAVRLSEGLGVALSPDSAWALTRTPPSPRDSCSFRYARASRASFPAGRPGPSDVRRVLSRRNEVRLRGERPGPRNPSLRPGGFGRRSARRSARRGSIHAHLRLSGRQAGSRRSDRTAVHLYPLDGGGPSAISPRQGRTTSRPDGRRTARASTSREADSPARSISSTSRPAAGRTCAISRAATPRGSRRSARPASHRTGRR